MAGQEAPHAPKVETFDLAARTNTDPKGVIRAVDEYRVEPFGLYLARPTPGRAQFHYLESWLLPQLGLRITDFWFNPGYERDQDFYLDVVHIERGNLRWLATDLYLDIVLRSGKDLAVLDTDELFGAVEAGLVDAVSARHACEVAFRTVEGLAGCGYDLADWLGRSGITTSWRRR
ncbi:MAG: DUF402 domain-containing protein [Pseudonocardiaceae bacterium]|nr:DUF402 domain-containing protein [Pseudonocardiaceae bacterium]